MDVVYSINSEIRLSQERREHIISNKPYIAVNAVARLKYLHIVYKEFRNNDGFVITAYISRKINRDRDRDTIVEKYFTKFDNIFKEQSQKYEFRLYGTALLLEIKRKNIQCISKHIVDSNYQSMHHFMHDAPYDDKAINNQRIDMLENNRSTKSCCDGYVIIDDTGNPKSGDFTFGTRRQWIGSIGKVDRGQVVVTSHYADARKDRAIDHRPYLPEQWIKEANARQNKVTYVFKSKLQLGLELIDELKKKGIKYSHLLIDGWYGNSRYIVFLIDSFSYMASSMW